MRKINIGLLGCGTVGTGVAKILIEKQNLLSSRIGAILNLKYVADLDIDKDRGIKFNDGVLTTDANQVINDPDIDIIVEMIGGHGFAKDIVLKAIENGKHIVTSNKALIALHGNQIFDIANKKQIDIAFEASVGGCMPIIKTLRESLIGNDIKYMIGILNGTCNYILSKITNEGTSFQDALKQAQENGFAEADPFLDVEGIDTAHKLSILISIAYGMKINFQNIYVEGITKLTPLDIDFARQFGYKIKLLAICKHMDNAIDARVHPTMIPCESMISNVNGSLNAISIYGDAVGETMLYGHGAGMMPTASAVISDIADIARNIISNTKNRVPSLSYQTDCIKNIPILPIEEIMTNYYFRFLAKDQPGVLSNISGVIGDYGISLKSVHQKGRKSTGYVPIVMLTHLAKEDNVQKALSIIKSQDIIKDEPVIVRIEDDTTTL